MSVEETRPKGQRTVFPLGPDGLHLTIEHNFEFNDQKGIPQFHLGVYNMYGEKDHFNLDDNLPGWPNCPNDLYPSLRRAPVRVGPY